MNLNKQPVDVDALIDDMLEARRVLDTKINALVEYIGGTLDYSDMIIDDKGYLYFYFNRTNYRSAKDLGHTQRLQMADLVYNVNQNSFTKLRNPKIISHGFRHVTEDLGIFDNWVSADKGMPNAPLYFLNNGELKLSYNPGLMQFDRKVSIALVYDVVLGGITALENENES